MRAHLFLARVMAAVALVVASPAWAGNARPLELDAFIDGAALAFQGRVLENRSEFDAGTGFIVTYTTFEVQDRLKGAAGATHTIKQVGGKVGNVGQRFGGVPSFAPGATYIVFLHGTSHLGFSSPVGLEQGAFAVLPGAGGPEVANGADFRFTLGNVPAADLPDGASRGLRSAASRVERLDLDEFKRIVRRRAAR